MHWECLFLPVAIESAKELQIAGKISAPLQHAQETKIVIGIRTSILFEGDTGKYDKARSKLNS